MRFVEVKRAPSRSKGNIQEVTEMLRDFLKSGILAAEIVEFTDAYKGAVPMYQTAQRIAKQYFPNEIRVSRHGDRVFITNLKEEAK